MRRPTTATAMAWRAPSTAQSMLQRRRRWFAHLLLPRILKYSFGGQCASRRFLAGCEASRALCSACKAFRSQGVLWQGDRRVKFCRQCGAPLEMRVPAGEREWRPVCTACSTVDYSNPKLVRPLVGP